MQHKIEISILRIFATILVICSHLVCQVCFNFDYWQWDKANLLYVFRDCCVPIFICITGIVSLDKEKPYKYYVKNAIKFMLLFLPLVFIFDVYRSGVRISCVNDILHSLYNGFLDPSYLWYLPLIAQINLLIPIYKKIAESQIATNVFLVIWICVSIMRPFVMQLLEMNDSFYSLFIHKTLNVLAFSELYTYGGYVILGYYLWNYFNRRVNILNLFIVLIATVLLGAQILSYIYKTKGIFLSTVWDYFSPFAFIETSCFVLIAKDYISKMRFHKCFVEAIGAMGNCTFGIYLIHPYFMAKAYAFFNDKNLFVSVPITAIVIFTLCFAIIWVLHIIKRALCKQFNR